jgi:uncharacterized membrane protein YgcG
MGTDATNGFDGWLVRELQQHASQVAGSNPLPSQARYHAVAIAGTALGAISFAILSTKTVTAAALSVVAIVAAGATTEAVITHSANPAVWGHQVVQQVDKCKAALPPGGHGIGECVSSFASQHGASSPSPQSDSGPSNGHPAGGPPSDHPKGGPPSTHPTPGNGGGNGGGNGDGNGGGNGGGNSGNGNGNGGGNDHGKP